MPPTLNRFARLAVALFLIGLLTSRVTLLVHEFGGHGATSMSVGSTITDHRLFVFAGGRIHFDRPEPYSAIERLYISMGGIALEIIVGALLLLVAASLRKRPLARVAVLGFAAINLVHGLFYLATAAFHGFGDGWGLHRMLGDAKWWLAIPVGLAAIVVTFFLARVVAASLRGWLRRYSPLVQVGLIAGGVAIAGGLHAGLTFGELKIAPDPGYAKLMEKESVRKVDRDLARYMAMQRARGAAPTKNQIASKRAALKDEHQDFPLAIVLGVCVGLAACGGVWRSRPRKSEPDDPPSWSSIGWLGAVTAAALLVVIVFREPW